MVACWWAEVEGAGCHPSTVPPATVALLSISCVCSVARDGVARALAPAAGARPADRATGGQFLDHGSSLEIDCTIQ